MPRLKTKPRGQMALDGCGLDESAPREVAPANAAFTVFWMLFPRKVSKHEAQKAFARAVKIAPAETIINGLRAQADTYHRSDPRFTPHAATWLNQRRWEDQVEHIAPREMTPAEQLERRMLERWLKEGKI